MTIRPNDTSRSRYIVTGDVGFWFSTLPVAIGEGVMGNFVFEAMQQ